MTTSADIDQQALINRYLEERDKRMRPDGLDQYTEVSRNGPLSRFLDDPTPFEPLLRQPIAKTVDVVVVGGGLGGVLNAAQLAKLGVTNMIQIEAAPGYGGTWYWNRFPGVRCDVEAAIYMPMLEETGVIPTERYARGEEIRHQLEALAEKFGLTDRTLFQTRVTRTEWSDEDERWIVTTDRGDEIRTRFIVLSSGRLHRLKLPGIKGIERFKGHSFHTGRWDYDYTGGDATGGLHKLADKRVAIIGTGATSVQVIPHLAEDAAELFVIQRTPTAVDVRANRPTDPAWGQTLQPGWQEARALNFEQVMVGEAGDDLVGDSWPEIWGRPELTGSETPDELLQKMTEHDLAQMERVRRRVDELVHDPTVADALKPYYFRFCKRPTFHDSFLQVFNQPNVHLVDTDGKGPDEIVEKGIVVKGKLYEVDCIVYATGQEWGRSPARVGDYDVIGRHEASLAEVWKNGESVRSLHGIFVHDFPNMLIHGSGYHAAAGANVTYSYTEQAKHLAAVVKELLDTKVRVFDLSEQVEKEYGELIDANARPDNPGCTPGFYNQEGKGKSLFAYQYWGTPIAYNHALAQWRADGGINRDLLPVRDSAYGRAPRREPDSAQRQKARTMAQLNYSHPPGPMALPPELEELKLHARAVVEKACFPLESKFLLDEHTETATGARPGTLAEGSLPAADWAQLRKVSQDSGLFAAGLPDDMGGLGMGIWGDFVVAEEIQRSVVLLPRASVPWILVDHGTAAQKEKYLHPTIAGGIRMAYAQSEPGAGSDPGNSMTTKAVKTDGGWIINGTKMWISGVQRSDYLLVLAVTDETKRQRGGITMFLLDLPADGVTIQGIPTWLTSRTETYSVFFDDVFVPDDQVLGEVGSGFGLGQQWLAIQDRLSRGSLAAGILSRALTMATEWAETRETFGAPLAERQAIQWMLVDVLMDLKSIRAISYEAAARADQGEDVRALASMAKYMGGNWGHRSIDKLMQIMGGMGETKELPFTTWYRQLRHGRIGGGTDEIQRMLMGRAIFKERESLWNA